jgi:hypothetical protein
LASCEAHSHQLGVLAEFRADGREYDLVVEVHGSSLFCRPTPADAAKPEM